MADSQLKQIVSRALIGVAGISQGFVEDIAAVVDRERENWKSPSEILEIVRNAIAEFEPLLAEHLSDSVLSGWINGYDHVAAQFPLWLQKEFSDSIRRRPPSEPPTVNLFSMFDREPRLKLLNVENAAKRLFERNILTREVFDSASDTAKRQAFTIAGDLGAETIDRFRGWLYRDLSDGTSLRGFRERVEDHLGTSPIAPGHLENVYRTNIQSALRDGRETLRQNPIVTAAFPYQQYIPIHDGRTRHEHEMLGTLGLDGTGVYRIDDPFWDSWTPPVHYNCFLPGTKIDGKFDLGFKSLYDGQAIEITTRSGNSIAVTANHPVLTNAGWKAAQFVDVSDSILGDIGNQRCGITESGTFAESAFVDTQKQNRPPFVQDVFGSIKDMGFVSRMPLRAKDLHGDSQPRNGDVEIVATNRLLLDALIPRRVQGVTYLSFIAKYLQLLFANSQRISVSTSRIPSHFFRNLLSLLFRQIRPVIATCDYSIAELDTRLSEVVSHNCVGASHLRGNFDCADSRFIELDNLSHIQSADRSRGTIDPFLLEQKAKASVTDSEFSHNFSDGSSRRIKLDDVVNVRAFHYRGHVYDFQSSTGIVIANRIIVSNCRCTVRLLTLDQAAKLGVKEAQQWLRTGRPPMQPEFRFAQIPFSPNPGWGQRGNVGVIVMSALPKDLNSVLKSCAK